MPSQTPFRGNSAPERRIFRKRPFEAISLRYLVGVGALDDPPRRAFRKRLFEAISLRCLVGGGALDAPHAMPSANASLSQFLSPQANFTCLKHISRAERISPAEGGFRCGLQPATRRALPRENSLPLSQDFHLPNMQRSKQKKLPQQVVESLSR